MSRFTIVCVPGASWFVFDLVARRDVKQCASREEARDEARRLNGVS